MKKKTVKKLTLAKETLRGLDKRDGLRHVAGGTDGFNYNYGFVGPRVTVETGCDFCQTGSCCTCMNSCAETECC